VVTVVLIRSDGGWTPAVLTSFESESALQALLHQDPSLIPGCAGAAVVRELGIPGVGSVDLVCVDDEGIVTIVECKLKANPQIRREIVGQIIAYASGLAGTSYEQFDTAFANRAGAPLLDYVSTTTGAEIDPATFRAAVTERLSTGAFRLVVAVDQITVELRQSVEYLNHHLSDSVLVMALEMGYLNHNGVELLVPQTYGAELGSLKDRGTAAGTRRWSAEEIAEIVAGLEEQDQRSTLERLLKHAADHGAKIKGGSGGNPSAGYYYLVAGTRRSMWSLYLKPQGPAIAINFGSVANSSPALAKAMADKLRTARVFAERLAQHDTVIGKYPEFSIASITQDESAGTALYEAFDLVLAAHSDDASGAL
jgi:hypothetical protein